MADLSTIFFNNPILSDFILTVNRESFYLSSDVLTKYTDFFKTKVEHQNINSDKNSVIVVVAKNVINVDDSNLKSEYVTAVLKSMYGIPLNINESNVMEIYSVSKKFRMKDLIGTCEDTIIENVNYETLFDDYLKAISEKSFMRDIYEKILKTNLFMYNNDQLFEFILKIPLNDFYSLLQLNVECSESLMYKIAEKYCKRNSLSLCTEGNLEEVSATATVSYGDKIKIMSLIKLEKLSGNFLVTNIKNNRYINRSNYYYHLERIALDYQKLDGNIFAFGKPDVKYQGYRIITKKECDSVQFAKLFADQYRKNNGLWSLDEFNVDVLCNDTYPLCIRNGSRNGSWIRLGDKDVKRNTFVKFKVSFDDENKFMNCVDEIISYVDINRSQSHNSRLFVSCDVNV